MTLFRKSLLARVPARLLACMLALALSGPVLARAAATLLVYGDSLSAAYGIGQKEGWVTLLEERLRQRHVDYTVANASISGETSSGGASRIAGVLAQYKPRIIIVALGANDGLRGLPVAQMRDNLAAVIGAARKSGCRVLLVGMKMPPNYGPQYTREFERTYGDLARRHGTGFVPFMLEGLAGRRDMFLDDNLHPVAAAQSIILENIWKGLAPLLK